MGGEYIEGNGFSLGIALLFCVKCVEVVFDDVPCVGGEGCASVWVIFFGGFEEANAGLLEDVVEFESGDVAVFVGESHGDAPVVHHDVEKIVFNLRNLRILSALISWLVHTIWSTYGSSYAEGWDKCCPCKIFFKKIKELD